MIMPCPDEGGYRKFGWQNKSNLTVHLGDDLKASSGTGVKTMEKGLVVLSKEINGFGSFNTKGGVIIIKHNSKIGNVYYSLYGHLNRMVDEGVELEKGEVMGLLSEYKIKYSNKITTLDHLHWGVWMHEEPPFGNYGYDHIFRYWINPTKFVEYWRG
jgi:murein DD-endopeptidase MepM/ murein hydrolase activator NlpD